MCRSIRHLKPNSLFNQCTGYVRKHALKKLPTSPFIFNNFTTPLSQGLNVSFLHASVGNTAMFRALLISRHSRWKDTTACAWLWFLYIYFWYSRRCTSAAVIPHMLHIGTFHRFKQFSVFQARRTIFLPSDLIHLFQLQGRPFGVYRKSYVTERLLWQMSVFSAQGGALAVLRWPQNPDLF